MTLALAALVLGYQTQAPTQAQIQAIYEKWDKAVVAHDLKTMKSVLASNFKAAQSANQKPLNRDEFLKQISDSWKSGAPREVSFTTVIKKLEKKADKLRVTVLETITYGREDDRGRKVSFSSIDTWQKLEGRWQVIATEPLPAKKK